MEVITPKKRIDRTVFGYHFAHSTYVSVTWNWFLELSGKLAAPILLASVLYAGLKLAQPDFAMRYLASFDAFISVAALLALDMGGLGLRAIAKQVREQGNEKGANAANNVALCMFTLMMVTLALSSVSSAFHWHESDYAWFVGLLLIARAILSVLYGILIHDLSSDKNDYSVVKSSDVHIRLNEFMDALLRVHQQLQETDTAIRSLAQNTENRIGLLAENVTLLSSMTEHNFTSLTEYLVAQLPNTEREITSTTKGQLLAVSEAIRSHVQMSLEPVVSQLQEQSETLTVLSELSAQIGQFEESARLEWRTVTEEVKVTVKEQMEVLPKLAERIVNQTPKTRTVVNASPSVPKGEKFNKGDFIRACLRDNPDVSIGTIQRLALDQGQKIVGSYISEVRDAFNKSQLAEVN